MSTLAGSPPSHSRQRKGTRLLLATICGSAALLLAGCVYDGYPGGYYGHGSRVYHSGGYYGGGYYRRGHHYGGHHTIGHGYGHGGFRRGGYGHGGGHGYGHY